MLENIFHKGVQCQYRDLHFFGIRIDPELLVQVVLETDLLDMQIIFLHA